MAYSIQEAVSDGTLTLLDIAISYFDRDDITVYFDGVQNAYPWEWVGTTQRTLSFYPAIPSGVVVRLRRNTDISQPRHIFSLGAQFTTQSMDEDLRQVLQIAQEAKEGGWGGGGGTSELREDLALPSGGTLVGFIQSGTGAVATTVQRKLLESVSVKDFGAVGDGVADDTAKVQAALNSLGTAGGLVIIPNGMTPLIDSNLNIPANCALVGAKAIRGRTFSTPNMNLWKPRIILNRSATITLNDSSEIRAIGIFAKNLTFSDTSTNVNSWAGQAVTIADNTADHLIEDCFIIGFGTGITTGANTRADRTRIHRCYFDCVNGIYLKNCYDVPYISDCHAWPWSTMQSTPETNSAHLKRNGAFIWLDGTINDWAKITDCFCYGWKVGYRLTSADSVTLTSCGADNPPGAADASIGFLIEGAAFENRLIGCQSAGRQTGIYIQTTDVNGRVFISDTNVWECFDSGINIVNGDVNLVNCGLRNTGGVGYGVYFQNTGTKLRLDHTKLNGFSIGIMTDSTGAVVLHQGCDFDGTTTPINNPFMKGIASANPLVLDGISTFFSVFGTANFNNINNAKMYVNKIVTLKFNGALFVSTGGNIKPAGGAAFLTKADDTITLASDGTTWYEVARSVN